MPKAEQSLHTAMCQAVAILNTAPEVARLEEGRQVREILRQALADYADDARAVVRFLRKERRKDVDGKRIAVLGHADRGRAVHRIRGDGAGTRSLAEAVGTSAVHQLHAVDTVAGCSVFVDRGGAANQLLQLRCDAIAFIQKIARRV